MTEQLTAQEFDPELVRDQSRIAREAILRIVDEREASGATLGIDVCSLYDEVRDIVEKQTGHDHDYEWDAYANEIYWMTRRPIDLEAGRDS